MLVRTNRRLFLAGLAAAAAPLLARAAAPSAEERLALANRHLAWIEEREGGRLGVAVIDTADRLDAGASRRRAVPDVQHVQASGRRRRAQAGRRRRRAARPGHRLRAGRSPRVRADRQDPSCVRRHDARRSLRRRDRLERQHRRQPGAAVDRRTGGLHPVCPFARRFGDPARPQRAELERGDARRRARYDSLRARWPRTCARFYWATCFRKRRDSSSKPG